MIGFIIGLLKIVFLLGFLVFIHEGGHFIIAKLCKVQVNEFSIGFGPKLFEKQGKKTKYQLRLIPLGGFVNLEGEEEPSEKEGSFSKASILKKIVIVIAGGTVNIIFGLLVYFLLACQITDIKNALLSTGDFIFSIVENLKILFTGGVKTDDLMGIVGISEIAIKTTTIQNYLYILALVSLSLGVTNLLPFPPLDGGKIVLYIIEAIRKKPLNQKIENVIQMTGFYILIGLSIFVMYNDVVRIL